MTDERKEPINTITKCPTCGAECEIKSSGGGSTHWYEPKEKGVLERKEAEPTEEDRKNAVSIIDDHWVEIEGKSDLEYLIAKALSSERRKAKLSVLESSVVKRLLAYASDENPLANSIIYEFESYKRILEKDEEGGETMKLEDQVCNLELSKRLKELGVKQDSWMSWVDFSDARPVLREQATWGDEEAKWWSAFTVAELGEMLPPHTPSMKDGQGYSCSTLMSEDGNDTHWDTVAAEKDFDAQVIWAGTEADVRAKMLIYLIENKLVKGASLARSSMV